MTVWQKALINLEKGYDKLSSFAAVFADRVKAEITIIRVRMQIDDVRDRIGEQQRLIGARLLAQRSEDALPRSFARFFQQDDIVAALERITQLEKELEMLQEELSDETAAVADASGKNEERAA